MSLGRRGASLRIRFGLLMVVLVVEEVVIVRVNALLGSRGRARARRS
jgi:hypothetical protein